MHLQKHLLMIMHCLSTLACFSLVNFNGRWIASSSKWLPEYYRGLQSASYHLHVVILQIQLGHRIKSKIYDGSNLCYMQTLISFQRNTQKFTKHREFIPPTDRSLIFYAEHRHDPRFVLCGSACRGAGQPQSSHPFNAYFWSHPTHTKTEYTQCMADNKWHSMNRFYCDPISLLAPYATGQLFSGSPCRHLPTVMLRGQLGVLPLHWHTHRVHSGGQAPESSGHVALDEGDVAVLALGHRPLLDRLLQDLARQPLRIVQHDGARGALLLRLHRQQRRLLPSAPLAASPDPLILDSVGTLEGSLGFDASHGTLENAAAKFSSTACFDNLEVVPLFDGVSLLLASGSSYFQRTEHLLLCFFRGNLSKQCFILRQ